MSKDRFRLRFWDKNNRVMLYSELPYGAFYGAIENQDIKNFLDLFIPLQCTGLKDSEGNLIWEGDIVEIKLEDHANSEYDYHTDTHITPQIVNKCEVRYRLHGGYVALVRNAPYKGNVLRLKDGHDKVIGNIYENPELLNQEAK